MDNVKVTTANHGKLALRELNLGQGGNNVRWLNDREERLLQTSLNSMEKAHKRALSRLQTEVKDLHHTLREQATIRSPLLTKEAYLLDEDVYELKRPATAVNTMTYKLHEEILAPSKTEEGTRGSAEEVKDSPLEYIALEDVNSHNQKMTGRSSGKTDKQSEMAWTRKPSSAQKRPLSKHLSNSSDSSSSSTTAASASRRKISVADSPAINIELSPRLRRTSSQNSLPLSANMAFNRGKTRSTEMINGTSTLLNTGNAINDPSPPRPRKVSAESINPVASPLFFRRKISQRHAPRCSSPSRVARKISCPPKLQHLPIVQQDEIIPLQLLRDNGATSSRVTKTMTTDLPKLEMPHGIEQTSPDCEGNVSPFGLHVNGIDCTLQEKVNNFLRSLETNDDIHEQEENRAHKQ